MNLIKKLLSNKKIDIVDTNPSLLAKSHEQA